MDTDRQIYLISGMGADRRAFQDLKLDFTGNVNHIDWISPYQKESLASYCRRLIGKYNIQDNSVVIGVSFGGIVAVEISKQVNLSKIILISSARNRNDLPLKLKLFGKLGLTKIIPKKAFGQSNFFVEKVFGVKTIKEKKLLGFILADTDTNFAKWAVSKITTWNESNSNKHIVRIHGDNDKLIPLKNKADYIIEKGTHFMIVQKSNEISEILNKELNIGNSK